MKALKSQLASELLADPDARDALRRFLVTQRKDASAAQPGASGQLQIRQGTRIATVKAEFVPKAKAA
jgi:hypothetical protein